MKVRVALGSASTEPPSEHERSAAAASAREPIDRRLRIQPPERNATRATILDLITYLDHSIHYKAAMKSTPWAGPILRDLRHAVRTIARMPVLATVIVLS